MPFSQDLAVFADFRVREGESFIRSCADLGNCGRDCLFVLYGGEGDLALIWSVFENPCKRIIGQEGQSPAYRTNWNLREVKNVDMS